MTRANKIALIVGLAVLALLALRAALPAIVESRINDRLANLEGYRGEVASVDLDLWRGAYELHGLALVKRDSRFDEPFFEVERVDLSLEWPALLDGEVVGEAVLREPILNLIQAEDPEDAQLGTEEDWAQRFNELFPFRFNSFEVVDGLVTFRAPGIEAEESMRLQNFELVLRNLTNVRETDEAAFAELELHGNVMGEAPLTLTGRMDPSESQPTFDLDLSLEDAAINEVNPWLEEFLNVDAEAGTFSLYAELAAADGSFEGYLRPILENLQILELDEPAEGPFQKVWEGLVETAKNLLTNPEEDQVATQVPFSGDIENPDAGLLPAMVNLLRNAFVAAFSHSLEGSVSLGDAAEEAAGSEDDDR